MGGNQPISLPAAAVELPYSLLCVEPGPVACALQLFVAAHYTELVAPGGAAAGKLSQKQGCLLD